MMRPVIRRLSSHVVDLIAAGEVVERPAAALKELVENALDAGATRLEVTLRGGGCELIDVRDNGRGMEAEELPLAVERHCTSKLPDDDLTAIKTLGFRGEALPSIGASARLFLTSRTETAETAWELSVQGGVVSGPVPSAGSVGTRVVVRDLFFATPARRKFLKTARVEGNHAEAVMRRVALSAPDCAISFVMDGREIFNLPPQDVRARVASILEVPEDGLLTVDEQRGPMRLGGYICGPGETRRTGSGQFMLVNNRPVMDPILRTAIRVAYRPVIEKGRFPVLLLHLRLPLDRVDVNVHPAKTELRFADEAEVRAFVIGAVGRALARSAGDGGGIQADLDIIGRRAASIGQNVPGTSYSYDHTGARAVPPADLGLGTSVRRFASSAVMEERQSAPGLAEPQQGYVTSGRIAQVEDGGGEEVPHPSVGGRQPEQPLGVPIGQIHATYILSIAPDGDLILTDQHAAHERLTHERLRARFAEGAVQAQALLMPEVVDLPHGAAEALSRCAEELARFGLEIESFGSGSVLVRSLPAPLSGSDVAGLLRDVADELVQMPDLPARQTDSLDGRFEAIMARMACHGSIRAGRILKQEEMEALLRGMEQHPRANTCPHGRPTWLKLDKDGLEKLFGRTR
ncbi:DNA mismatch repair protein MutL [Parasaccharibacter apium]|uniref:DNA mismatch repair protein MutL n=2 Tax=Acetobacteraceae TaxID=433 RepID=A0A7U7J091_9PROT|nr:DNA mismatch repair endonuclease MutL [Parasaccharibacter apium]CDG33275.1 DNA mismatch repair protein MutL [Parasaccharibacter apium]